MDAGSKRTTRTANARAGSTSRIGSARLKAIMSAVLDADARQLPETRLPLSKNTLSSMQLLSCSMVDDEC